MNWHLNIFSPALLVGLESSLPLGWESNISITKTVFRQIRRMDFKIKSFTNLRHIKVNTFDMTNLHLLKSSVSREIMLMLDEASDIWHHNYNIWKTESSRCWGFSTYKLASVLFLFVFCPFYSQLVTLFLSKQRPQNSLLMQSLRNLLKTSCWCLSRVTIL